jgi:hypothetical protein
MPMNRVQSQKGLSFGEFMRRFGTEEGREQEHQCCSCRHQSSLISGTVMASSKLPLRMWFLGGTVQIDEAFLGGQVSVKSVVAAAAPAQRGEPPSHEPVTPAPPPKPSGSGRPLMLHLFESWRPNKRVRNVNAVEAAALEFRTLHGPLAVECSMSL